MKFGFVIILLLLITFNAAGQSIDVRCSSENGDSGISACTEALRQVPNWSAGYFRRGLLWMDKKEFDKSISDFTQALNISPGVSSGYYFRGEAKAEKNDLNGAIQDFTEAIKLEPTSIDARKKRAALFFKLQKWDDALSDLNEIIKYKPDVWSLLNRSGVFHQLATTSFSPIILLDKGIADCNDAIRIAPNPTEYEKRMIETCKKMMAISYLYRAELNFKNNDINKAILDVNEVIRLQPSNSEASKNLQKYLKAQEAKSLSKTNESLEVAKKKCIDLGFKPSTERFGQCVIRLAN